MGGGVDAGGGDGVAGDLAEQRGDVHVRAVGDLELLGACGGVGGGLALDLDFDGRWEVLAAVADWAMGVWVVLGVWTAVAIFLALGTMPLVLWDCGTGSCRLRRF